MLLHELLNDSSTSDTFKRLAEQALKAEPKDELMIPESQRGSFGKFPVDTLNWIITNVNVLAVFSAPGGGKGTLIGPLLEALNARMRDLGMTQRYVVVSTGDWLRKIKEGLLNEDGSLRDPHERDASLEHIAISVWKSLDEFRIQMDEMQKGQLLNAGTVDELLRQVLRHPDVRGQRIILDGWPRSREQLKTLQKETIFQQVMKDGKLIDVPLKIDFSIMMEAPEPILRLRSLFRWLARYEARDPKQKPRSDDLPARHANRMVEMENETTPIIQEIEKVTHHITIRGYTMPEWKIAERYRLLIDDLMRLMDDKWEIIERIRHEKISRDVSRLPYFENSELEALSKARVRENFVEALTLYRAELGLPQDRATFGAKLYILCFTRRSCISLS